jgi:hypothetical protein
MKLEPSHSPEDKAKWKIMNTDDYTDICPNAKGEGMIVSADEDTGEYCIYIRGEKKTLTLGPNKIRIIAR